MTVTIMGLAQEAGVWCIDMDLTITNPESQKTEMYAIGKRLPCLHK
jgi:hypothetical protein